MSVTTLNTNVDYFTAARTSSNSLIAILNGHSYYSEVAFNPKISPTATTYSTTPDYFTCIRTNSAPDTSSRYSSYGLEWKGEKGTNISLSG